MGEVDERTCHGVQPGADHDLAQAALAVARRDRERAKAAQAQVLRERERGRLALEQALRLQAELDALRASAAWRLTWPVRRLAAAVPAPVYAKLRRAPGRFLRPRKGAASAIASNAAPDSPPGIMRRPAALLVDDRWPQPDRDAGSIEIVNLAEALLALGFHVIFAADRQFAESSPDRDALARRGIRCLGLADAASVDAFLERHGRYLDLCVLNRVYGGGRFLDAVQRHCPSARILFNTIDLHWVRLEREARLRDDAAGLAMAAYTRERELKLAQAADATIVVSSVEQGVLAQAASDAYVIALPLAREARMLQTPFAARDGVGFIGGFQHAPNLDALRFFLAEIWPLVLKALPACRFSIVGADLPPGTLDHVPGTVRYLGHLPDIEPWFEGLRLTVAPLRYGAGLKGKVVSSLAAGVPCVATSIAMEGIAMREEAALVADTPEALAQAIVAVHSDPVLWSRLSTDGRAYVEAHLSIAAWRRRLAEALWTLGVLPDSPS